MAKHTIDLFTNQSKYERFSAAASRRAVDNFDSKIIIAKYEEYYQRILELSWDGLSLQE